MASGNWQLCRWVVVSSFLALALSACSSAAPTATPAPTRLATQTPWIIYVPVTTTPEPATVTPLPTVTLARAGATATRTRVAVPATKAPVVPTKAAVVVAPSPTAAPACSASLRPNDPVRFPENGAPRNTRRDQGGGSAFIFKWTPYQPNETDPQIGYRIWMESRRGSQVVNGATIYISHNKFLSERQLIFDQVPVSRLAAGDNATVYWNITVVKTTGSFDDQGGVTGNLVNCGPSNETWTIQLIVND